jgi:L-threonylcarbamoyladenylate synthase
MEVEIIKCLNVLKSGGVIVYPTDTVWGIGCDATNEAAVENIYRLKQRSERKSLIILLDDAGRIRDYVEEVPVSALQMAGNSDIPLTIIYPGARNLASNVIAEDGSVAIRIPDHEFCRRLIRAFGKPLVSTSANISGAEPPVHFGEIPSGIISGVDHTVDPMFDQKSASKPSRIIRISKDGSFDVIRP